MGRAIVRNPTVFLFDEPLSNLDARLRTSMRMEIARLHRKLEATTIYVTHDQVEAMTLADRIAVLHNGMVRQVDTPKGLYDRPAHIMVAEFIGSPAMNLIRGRINRDEDGSRTLFQSKSLNIAQPSWEHARRGNRGYSPGTYCRRSCRHALRRH